MAEAATPKPKVTSLALRAWCTFRLLNRRRGWQVFVVFYSMYGHIKTMAETVKEGLEEAGCEVSLYQIAETLPQEILDKMHAPPKDDSVSSTELFPSALGFCRWKESWWTD